MSSASPLLLHAPPVQASFARMGHRVFTPSDLVTFVRANISDWECSLDPSSTELPPLVDSGEVWVLPSASNNAVLNSLVHHKTVKKVTLPFPYRTEHRYIVGTVSDFELVQSLDRAGYFSHFTAIRLNALTEQVPKTIYFNVEQSASSGGGELTQEGLDRAFKSKPRISSNVIEYNQVRIHRLNGGNTNQLGVTEIVADDSTVQLRVTDIERTLIDATVRPTYSGGIAVVATAFEMATDRISVKKLAQYLKKLRYTYPYHQAIGFYLERAGYEDSDLGLLRDFPIEFDFYLSHGMKSTEYNATWRLFAPKGF